jgi:hypothetical protein
MICRRGLFFQGQGLRMRKKAVTDNEYFLNKRNIKIGKIRNDHN